MGLGRRRWPALACVGLGGLVLTAAGCGAETHNNDPRPPISVRVSVTVTEKAVDVTPNVVGVGPDQNQQITQNKGTPQPNIPGNGPLTIAFVSANLTGVDSHLVISGPHDVTSGPLVANGNMVFQTALPSGSYTISAADMPAASKAHFLVGRYRASSKNDVLLP